MVEKQPVQAQRQPQLKGEEALQSERETAENSEFLLLLCHEDSLNVISRDKIGSHLG